MSDFLNVAGQVLTTSINIFFIFLAVLFFSMGLWTAAENSKLLQENESLKSEGKPKNNPTLYVKYAKANYRVKLVGNTIWVERQQPSAINMPLPEDKINSSLVLVGHYWHHHNISSAISLYEALEENSQQELQS